jgi:hypothetical protein
MAGQPHHRSCSAPTCRTQAGRSLCVWVTRLHGRETTRSRGRASRRSAPSRTRRGRSVRGEAKSRSRRRSGAASATARKGCPSPPPSTPCRMPGASRIEAPRACPRGADRADGRGCQDRGVGGMPAGQEDATRLLTRGAPTRSRSGAGSGRTSRTRASRAASPVTVLVRFTG